MYEYSMYNMYTVPTKHYSTFTAHFFVQIDVAVKTLRVDAMGHGEKVHAHTHLHTHTHTQFMYIA